MNFFFADTVISSQYWQGFILAKLASHFVNCDSPFEHVRERSEAIITQEIDFAIHLGIEKIVVDLPSLQDCPNIDNLARILNRYLEDVHVVQKFILKITMPGTDEEAEQIYSRFLQLKQLCNHNTSLSTILDLQPDLPSEEILNRFWGESVFAIQVSSQTFVRNPKDYPVLSIRHQKVIKDYMKSQCAVILRPANLSDDMQDQLLYLTQYLFSSHDKLDREE